MGGTSKEKLLGMGSLRDLNRKKSTTDSEREDRLLESLYYTGDLPILPKPGTLKVFRRYGKLCLLDQDGNVHDFFSVKQWVVLDQYNLKKQKDLIGRKPGIGYLSKIIYWKRLLFYSILT